MVIDANYFPDSPFEPGHHVSPENFKGRSEDIIRIIRHIPKVINQGKMEHFFVIGKRAMGKTSFVKYLGSKVEEDFHMLPIYINNEGKDDVNGLIQNLLEVIFQELDKDSLGQQIIEKFVGNIQEIKVAGSGFSLKNKLIWWMI